VLAALSFFVLSLLIFFMTGPAKFMRSAHDLMDAPAAPHVPKTLSDTPDPNAIATEHRATEITHLLQRHWEDSLLAVEKVNIKDVTILEFHPDYGNGALVLRGEAREFDALADYIKQLNSTGLVTHVALMHEQAVSREHVDTIEFELKGDL
jgi:Na+-transporting methylmalonyl-CoA/oxaloacetate decarboxylase gamma subunit